MTNRKLDTMVAVFREVLNLGPDRDPRDAVPGDDWSWDSLAHVTLVSALESEFEVSIDLDTSLSITSFASAVEAVAAAGVSFVSEDG